MSKRAAKRAKDKREVRRFEFEKLDVADKKSRKRPGSLNPRKSK